MRTKHDKITLLWVTRITMVLAPLAMCHGEHFASMSFVGIAIIAHIMRKEII